MADFDPNDGKPADDDAGIVREGMDRWKACREWQGEQDELTRFDIKFANGDPHNRWQWPDKIYEDRDGDDLPCLTINNTRVHNDLIINQMSKNNYGVKVRPMGGGASYKSAEMMQTLIRRTENISRFTSQRRKVTEHQVDGGIGYVLIETDYVSERSFDQEIYLRAAQDPTGIFLDPWIKEVDGLDARFGFVFERMSRKTFNLKYPKYKDSVSQSPFDAYFESWMTDKEIVVSKYYRKKQNKDTLISYKDADGNEHEKLVSEIKEEAGNELYKKLAEDIKEGRIDGRKRDVVNDTVEWFLIAGNTIVDRGTWPGKYIPICRCVGRETVIDGTLDRKGHTRPLIDANRMLNYNASVAVQTVAFQPKASFMGPARAFEGQEQYKTMNIDGFPVLLYNDIDEEAPLELQKIDAPIRLDPPKISAAHVQGMQDAERQMMMISGQFQAQMGENDTQSAASGKAIGERQQQGDTATYHFPEHQAAMLRAIGIQLIDLYPKIYDTERVLHVTGEKGEKNWLLKVNPNLESPVEENEYDEEDEEAIRAILNPSVGQYECVSDPGPDYATQRQEAWEAFSAVVQHNAELMGVIGDLIFRYGDFPGADKLAERLKKEIKAGKPYLFDDNVDPALQAAQAQNQRLVALNAELMQKVATQDIALKGRDEKRDVEAFRAETDRMKAEIAALKDMILSPADRAKMEHDLTSKAHDHVYAMIQQNNAAEIQAQAGEGDDGEGGGGGSSGSSPKRATTPRRAFVAPPMNGARLAPDGHHYVQHPGTGQYFRVDRAQ